MSADSKSLGDLLPKPVAAAVGKLITFLGLLYIATELVVRFPVPTFRWAAYAIGIGLCIVWRTTKPPASTVVDSGGKQIELSPQKGKSVWCPLVGVSLLAMLITDFIVFGKEPILEATTPDVLNKAHPVMVSVSDAETISDGQMERCLLHPEQFDASDIEFLVQIRENEVQTELLLESCTIDLLQFTPKTIVGYVDRGGIGEVEEVRLYVPIGTTVGEYQPDEVSISASNISSPALWQPRSISIQDDYWTTFNVIPYFSEPGIYKIQATIEFSADLKSSRRITWQPVTIAVIEVRRTDESEAGLRQSEPGLRFSTRNMDVVLIGYPTGTRHGELLITEQVQIPSPATDEQPAPDPTKRDTESPCASRSY